MPSIAFSVGGVRGLLKRSILLLPLICVSAPGRVFAATVTWIGGADNNWYSAANWSPPQVPASVDSVLIDANTTVVVNPSSPSISFASLTLGGTATPTLKISNPLSTSGSILINQRATLQQDSNLQWSVGQVTVASGGLITHSANGAARSFVVNMAVSGNFDLQGGATISAAGLGYAGGNLNTHNGFGPGGGISGNYDSGGGGHGGIGGISLAGTAGGGGYDDLVNPTDLGSGAGWTVQFNATGASGGGAVLLSVGGTLSLNGLIDASGAQGNGGGAYSGTGGGGGGTVNVAAATLTGAGTIRANGGAGFAANAGVGGGGGGGRVAIAVSGSDASSLTVQANAGLRGGSPSSSGNGGAGTIAIKTPGGANYNLTVGDLAHSPQAGTPVSGSSVTLSTVTLDNSIVVFDPGSTVSMNSLYIVGTAAVTANNLVFGNNAAFVVSPGAQLTLTAASLSFGAGSSMEVKGVFRLAAQSISGAVLNVRTGGTFSQSNAVPLSLQSVLVESGGLLTHGANSASRQAVLNLNVSGDFNLQAGATVSAAGLGYAGGNLNIHNGFGPGGGISGNYDSGGGGHGGIGGISLAGTAGGGGYDDLVNPADLGSGAGWTVQFNATGASGGGAVLLSVGGTLSLNGLIDASGAQGNGGGAYSGTGGGGGGTVNVAAATLTGAGTIRANGGAGFAANAGVGGGGGGGRVAIAVSGSDASSLTVQANAGLRGGSPSSSGNGGAGTIAIKEPSAAKFSLIIGDPFIIPQAATPITGVASFANVTLNNVLMTIGMGAAPNIDTLIAAGAANVTAGNLVLPPAGSVVVNPGASLSITASAVSAGNLSIASNGVFKQQSVLPWSFASVNLSPGAVLTHGANGSTRQAILNLNVSGDLTLQTGAVISAAGLGYAGGNLNNHNGFGPGGGISGNYDSGGGGHGGTGGTSRGGAAGGGSYDDLTNPSDLGSGAGWTVQFNVNGGAGGGAVLLSVGGTLSLNGLIDASGADGNVGGPSAAGGGGGGTVNIAATTLNGTGTVRANGGQGANAIGGGGGGGRISLFYGTRTGSVAVQANSGSPGGGAGTVLDNGQLVGGISAASNPTVAASQMQEQLSSSQNLSETISAQVLDFSGATSTGASPGTFTLAQVNLVTIQSGAFAGKGFFRGIWTLGFPSGDSLSGIWQGAAFLATSPRQMVIKGSMEGGIRGALEGAITESVPGSGNFDRMSIACSALQVNTAVGASSLYFSGSAAAPQTTQYAGTSLSLLQSSLTGQTSGYSVGPLDTTFTVVRINSPGNPYNGEGFFLPSYSSSFGTGVGWAYAIAPFGQVVRVSGLFNQPLHMLFNGVLVLSSPRSLLLTLERLDVGLPIQAQLRLDQTAPGTATPGAVVSFSVIVHNDGFVTSAPVTVVAIAPDWTDFVSAGGSYVKYNIANWLPSSLFSNKPFVRWDNVVVPPRAAVTLTYQGRFGNVVNGGPGAHQPLGGDAQIVTKSWADQVFSHYPAGGTP